MHPTKFCKMREEVGRTTLECRKIFMVKGKKEEKAVVDVSSVPD